jgi:hypothetical protein
LVVKTTGTPYQLITLYYGIPIIISPIIFVFVFGDYNDILGLIFTLGMFKMISASFQKYKSK